MRMWRAIGKRAANDVMLTNDDCGHIVHVGSCASCQRRALARSREQLAVATGCRRERLPTERQASSAVRPSIQSR